MPIIVPDKEWMNPTEAARYLGVSKQTVYNLMDEGTLPFSSLKGVQKRRIKKSDLDALMGNGGESEKQGKKKKKR